MTPRVSASLLAILVATSVGCRSKESRAASFLERGKQLLALKDAGRAILELKNGLRLTPGNPEISYELGLAYTAARLPQKALAALQEAVRLNPHYVPAQLKIAELLATSGNRAGVAQAAERVRQVLTQDSDNPDALTFLAFTEMLSGKISHAKEDLTRALRRAPATLSASAMLASAKLRENDAKAAELVLQNAVRDAPRSTEALIVLGRFYRLTNRPTDAAVQFERALNLDKSNAAALLDAAELAFRSGDNRGAGEFYRRISALPETRYRPLHAMFLLETGDYNGGVAELERLLKADPADRHTRSRLIAAYIAKGRTAEVEKLLVTALSQNPRDADALLQRAMLRIGARHWPDAEADLATVEHFYPEAVQPHLLRAEIHRARGQLLGERQELTEALRLNPLLLEARIWLAQLFLHSGNAKTAFEVMAQAPPAQQKLLPYMVERNWALLASGDIAAAETAIQETLGVARLPEVLLQKATVRMSHHDYTGTRVLLEEALKRNPGDLRCLDLLAESFQAQRQPAAALARIRKQVEQRPHSAALQGFLGEYLLRHGDANGAKLAFEAARAAAPKSVAPELALARLEMAGRNFSVARQRLTSILSRDASQGEAMLLLGIVEEQSGDLSDAVAQYRRILEAQPDNVTALNNLAYDLARLGRLDEAMAYSQSAVEKAPDEATTLDTLGWIYYQKGLYASAVPYLDKAASRTGSPLYKLHLGLACLKAGDAHRGNSLVSTALAADPTLLSAFRDDLSHRRL